MATVQVLNKARMLAIEAASIVSARLSGNNLILTKFNGVDIDVGSVRGATGSQGPSGLAASELAGAGFNLDGLTSPFTWSQSDDSEAASGINYPVPYAGILRILANPAATQIYQTYTVNNAGPYANNIYARGRTAGVWSSWRAISSIGISEIAGSVNLDTLTSTTDYTQSDDADAASGSNYPVSYAGLLQVYSNSGATQVYQTYTVNNAGPYAGNIYSRVRTAGIWSSWRGVSVSDSPWTDLTLPDANVVSYDVSGAGYAQPQYRIDGNTVRLRGLAKTLTARTSNFTIADISAFPPLETDIFVQCCNITQTSSASSAASTGAASTGTAHTHTMPHTHTVSVPMIRLDVTSAGLITTSGVSSTNPFAANGFISLAGITWDLV